MRKRKPHCLKPLVGSKYPNEFIFFDTETKEVKVKEGEFVHYLVLGWGIYWRRRCDGKKDTVQYFYFEKETDFWSYVFSRLRRNHPIYLISHNIVFDFTILKGFKFLRETEFNLTNFYSEDKTTIMRFKKGGKQLIILDNLNFFKVSLKELGEEIGLKKKEIDFNNTTIKELSSYCKKDVTILYKNFKNYLTYLQKNNLGNFGLTLPQQSMNAFRKRFLKVPIYIHNYQKALELERKAYYGGRNECYFLGVPPSNPIYVLDINSMYPYVMLANKYPILLKGYYKKASLKILREKINKYLCIAKVKIKTKKPIYPLRRKNKLIFATGSFNTYLAHPELKEALKRNAITEVYDISFYKGDFIFKEFVEYFYRDKVKADKEGRRAWKYFNKIILNSLYGKFGQLATTWEKVGECSKDIIKVIDVADYHTQKKERLYFFNGNIYKVIKEGESFNSFVAIAACVTSYARIYIYHLIERAGKENVYYIDTDCLFTNERGYKNLSDYISDDTLGKLSLRNVSKQAYIFGLKDYILDLEVKTKGIRKNAIKVSNNEYIQEKWSTFKTLFINRNLETYKVYHVKKVLKRKYDKGVITETGWVGPFVL